MKNMLRILGLCSCLPLLMRTTLASEEKKKDYAVYFKVDGGEPNPFGRGYNPNSPPKWQYVDEEAWPVFVDWGDILDDTYWWDKGNLCKDRSRASYTDKHRQSPVVLTSDDRCEDTEPIFHRMVGKCAKDEVEFYTTPYGLDAVFEDCEEVPEIEHSLNDDPWKLVHMVVKVPAEHKVDDGRGGKTVQYDGEIQLHYKGSKDKSDKYLEGHAENIAITSILLKADSDKKDEELDKYIDQWEKYQDEQYEECDVEFDKKTCELVDDRDPPNDKCEVCYNKGCCEPHRDLQASFSHTILRGNEPGSKLSSAVKAIIQEQEQEISRLQNRITRCEAENSAESDRNLWGDDQDCRGSHFCPLALYQNTGTEFYYNYKGSLTVPPCTENVHWRVMLKPLIISDRQLQKLERLTFRHLEYPECKLTTVGKPRKKGCAVDVNRPIQALSISHNLQMCDSFSEGAYYEEEEEDEEDEAAKEKRGYFHG